MHSVLNENREMIESFTLISQELSNLATNLKESEKEREKLREEEGKIDAVAVAEALVSKAAAVAAEEARRAAEFSVKHIRETTNVTKIEKVTVEVVNKEREPSLTKEREISVVKQAQEESDEKTPEFVVPLRNAIVREGEKFKFECKVIGKPIPEVIWLKDDIPVVNNPDYQTSFEPEEGICTLNIEETFAEDTAKFTCKATNSAGEAKTTALLTVSGIFLKKSKLLFFQILKFCSKNIY